MAEGFDVPRLPDRWLENTTLMGGRERNILRRQGQQASHRAVALRGQDASALLDLLNQPTELVFGRSYVRRMHVANMAMLSLITSRCGDFHLWPAITTGRDAWATP